MAAGYPAIRGLSRLQCIAPIRYEDCPPLLAYQQVKPRVPTMGGLFVLGCAIFAAAVFGAFSHKDSWWVLGAVLAFGGMGLVDDVFKFRGENALGLRSLPKLLLALAIGAAIGYAMWQKPAAERLLDIPGFSQSIDMGWGWVPLAMLVMAGCAHAVNLTDGMDGLAAGCVALALMAVGFWALNSRGPSPVIMLWSAAFAGSCVGFLWFNAFPASIYLGDVGALGLGAALAVLSLFSHAALWLLLIGGVFVVEALSVILQVASYKWRNKKRIFRVAPIHHHFHLAGLSEPKVIVRFWIAGLLLAAISMAANVR